MVRLPAGRARLSAKREPRPVRAPLLALFCGNASVPAGRARQALAGWSLASALLGMLHQALHAPAGGVRTD